VAVQHRLRTVLFCACLQMGVIFGIPMRPEEIRELMQTMNRQQISEQEPERADSSEKTLTRTR